MRLEGRPFAPRSGRDGIRAGVGFLPDDRKREGLALGQTLRDNAALTLRAFAARARPARRRRACRTRRSTTSMRALDVRTARYDNPIRLLSGGNQQKVIIARWLARDPQLLIFAEPTRGIDVAAKAAIYAIMRDLASRGRGILMISSDLPEVIGVSDRIVVMRDGRIAGELPGGATEEEVMALAVGHQASAAHARVRRMSLAVSSTAMRRRRAISVPLLLFVGLGRALRRRGGLDALAQSARRRRGSSVCCSAWWRSGPWRSARRS